MLFMMLGFWVGEHHEGSASLVSDLLVAYEAHKRLMPGRSSCAETDEANP